MTSENPATDVLETQPFRRAAVALLAILVAGLLARILDYPLNRDENMFVTAAAQLPYWRLYTDLGFNHLPNLPHLLSTLLQLSGIDSPLLAGRLITFTFWLMTLFTLWRIGRRLDSGGLATFTAILLLLGNVMLLGEPGMLASNNLAPIPFALLAFLFLHYGLDEGLASPVSIFNAGMLASLAIGFKSNYVFLAPCFALTVLLAPAERAFSRRLTYGLAPLALGGIVGGLPVLAYFAQDPDALMAHTLRYFTELHAAYWATAATETQVATIAQRIVLAEQMWLANTSLLTLAGIAALLLIPALRGGKAAAMQALGRWPLLLALTLTACGAVVAFIPKPSFPQYFVPPLPFLLLAFLVAASLLKPGERTAARPFVLTMAVLALAGSVSRLLPDLPKLATPGSLNVVRLHGQSQELALRAGLLPGEKVATLSPALALEAGLEIYPEFAAGPFVYRVAAYIPARDLRHYRAVTPAGLPPFLDRDPPAAILFENAETPDPAFAAYAAENGYLPAAPAADSGKAPFRLLIRHRRAE
jgi:hypothetical protein